MNRAIFIGPAPSVDMLREDAAGRTWADGAVIRALQSRLANDGRALATNASAEVDWPLSVADFVTSKRGISTLEGFNHGAKTMVESLAQRGVPELNKDVLRRCLEVAAFASAKYPTMAREQWDTVIDILIDWARQAGKEPGILATWRATRYQDAAVEGAVDVDLSGLAGVTVPAPTK